MEKYSQTNMTDQNTSTSINSRAMSRFNEIKSRMKLNLFNQVITNVDYPQREVDRKQIQELLDHPNQNEKFSSKDPRVNKIVESNRKFVDEAFGFINTLPLNDVAKVGMGFILSAFASNNDEDFNNGIKKLIEAYNVREKTEENLSEGNQGNNPTGGSL